MDTKIIVMLIFLVFAILISLVVAKGQLNITSIFNQHLQQHVPAQTPKVQIVWPTTDSYLTFYKSQDGYYWSYIVIRSSKNFKYFNLVTSFPLHGQPVPVFLYKKDGYYYYKIVFKAQTVHENGDTIQVRVDSDVLSNTITIFPDIQSVAQNYKVEIASAYLVNNSVVRSFILLSATSDLLNSETSKIIVNTINYGQSFVYNSSTIKLDGKTYNAKVYVNNKPVRVGQKIESGDVVTFVITNTAYIVNYFASGLKHVISVYIMFNHNNKLSDEKKMLIEAYNVLNKISNVTQNLTKKEQNNTLELDLSGINWSAGVQANINASSLFEGDIPIPPGFNFIWYTISSIGLVKGMDEYMPYMFVNFYDYSKLFNLQNTKVMVAVLPFYVYQPALTSTAYGIVLSHQPAITRYYIMFEVVNKTNVYLAVYGFDLILNQTNTTYNTAFAKLAVIGAYPHKNSVVLDMLNVKTQTAYRIVFNTTTHTAVIYKTLNLQDFKSKSDFVVSSDYFNQQNYYVVYARYNNLNNVSQGHIALFVIKKSDFSIVQSTELDLNEHVFYAHYNNNTNTLTVYLADRVVNITFPKNPSKNGAYYVQGGSVVSYIVNQHYPQYMLFTKNNSVYGVYVDSTLFNTSVERIVTFGPDLMLLTKTTKGKQIVIDLDAGLVYDAQTNYTVYATKTSFVSSIFKSTLGTQFLNDNTEFFATNMYYNLQLDAGSGNYYMFLYDIDSKAMMNVTKSMTQVILTRYDGSAYTNKGKKYYMFKLDKNLTFNVTRFGDNIILTKDGQIVIKFVKLGTPEQVVQELLQKTDYTIQTSATFSVKISTVYNIQARLTDVSNAFTIHWIY